MPVKLERSSPCLEDLPTASVSSPFSGKCEETAIDAPIKAGAGKALPSVPLSQAHKAELELIFAQDQRLPSLASRKAWATARNTNLSSVNSWFFRKRYRTLSLQGIKLPEGTYNLPIETPNLSNPTVQESGDKLVPVKRELASPPAAKRPSKRRKVAHTRPTEGKKPPLMPQNLAKVTTTTPKDDTTGDSGVNRCSQRETLHIGSSRTSSGAYTQVSGSEGTETQNQKDREAPPVKRKRVPELCEATQAVLQSKPCFPKVTNADVSSPVLDGPQDIPVLRPPSSVSSRPGTPEKPPKPVRPVESAPAVQRGSGRNPNASTEGAGHAGTIVSKAEKTNAGVAEPEGPLKKICKRRKPTTGNNRKMPKGKASKSKTKGVAKGGLPCTLSGLLIFYRLVSFIVSGIASTCDVEDGASFVHFFPFDTLFILGLEPKVVPAAATLTKPQKRQGMSWNYFYPREIKISIL